MEIVTFLLKTFLKKEKLMFKCFFFITFILPIFSGNDDTLPQVDQQFDHVKRSVRIPNHDKYYEGRPSFLSPRDSIHNPEK